MDQLEYRRALAIPMLKYDYVPLLPALKPPVGPGGKPCNDVRYDRIDHHVSKIPVQKRCQLETCGTFTKYKCKKCDVAVHPHCTEAFHTPPKK